MAGEPSAELRIANAQNEDAVLKRHRISSVDIYEVLAVDLDRLDELVSQETQALGFATLALSSALAAALSWITMDNPSAKQVAFCASILASGGIIGLFFAATYLRVHRARPKLLERIKAASLARQPADG